MGMDNITPPIGCGSVAFRMPTIQDIYCSELERDVANLLANLCDANKEAEKLKAERDAIRDEHDKLVSGVKSITEGMYNYAATCGDETVAMNIRLYGRAIKAVLKKYEALREDKP